MKTKEDFDIDDELADAAITTVGLTRVDLSTFFLRLYQWMEKIEKDNAQVIEYGNKFGWLHWECITDLNNRHYYLSEVTGILKTLQELVNGYGKIKFTVPDVFDMSDQAGELNERIGRMVYKQIDEDQFCIDSSNANTSRSYTSSSRSSGTSTGWSRNSPPPTGTGRRSELRPTSSTGSGIPAISATESFRIKIPSSTTNPTHSSPPRR